MPALTLRTRVLPNMYPPISSPLPAAAGCACAETCANSIEILSYRYSVRDSRAESVHLKPDSTYKFESDGSDSVVSETEQKMPALKTGDLYKTHCKQARTDLLRPS